MHEPASLRPQLEVCADPPSDEQPGSLVYKLCFFVGGIFPEFPDSAKLRDGSDVWDHFSTTTHSNGLSRRETCQLADLPYRCAKLALADIRPSEANHGIVVKVFKEKFGHDDMLYSIEDMFANCCLCYRIEAPLMS